MVQKLTDDNFEISYLYGADPKKLFYILAETADSIERDFPGVGLSFEAVNDNSQKLIEHIFSKPRITHIFEATM